MPNFTLQDATGSTRALVAFSAILICPGYLLACATDLFHFRTRRLSERLAWAVALSFAAMPIFTQLAARVIGVTGVAIASAVFACATFALLIKARTPIRIPRDPHVRLLIAFLLCGAAFIFAELLDFQFGNHLHLSVTTLDQGYRVGFTNAIARTGIPPANPFYHPGAFVPLRYYYFWYALCAVCMKLAHVSARQALIASSAWSAFGLIALIALYLRHFLQIREGLRRHILTAALLLTVTGADLFPVLYNLLANNDFGGETEWWSSDQVSSWMDTFLWVPNHAAALIASLTVFLLLWRTLEPISRRHRIAATLLAGTAAASAFGLSIYVAAGLAMMLTAWTIRTLTVANLAVAKNAVNASLPLPCPRISPQTALRIPIHLAIIAATSILLLTPYLLDLVHSQSGTEARTQGGPTHVLAFGFRRIIDPTLITSLPRFAHLNATHPILFDQTIRLLLLIPGYAIELGFFGAVLVFAMLDRKKADGHKPEEPRRTALFLALTGLIITGVIRSSVIGNNDFATRASLIPCFFLLLLAVEAFLDLQDKKVPYQHRRAALIGPLLLLGLGGTAFQALGLRFYVPIHSSHRAPGFEGLAQTVLDTRTTYAAAAPLIPANAIIQSNPTDQASYFFVAHMLFTPRPLATDAAVDCGSVFGGDPTSCQSLRQDLRQLFNSTGIGPQSTRDLCTRDGIQYLAVSSHDPAWQDPAGWVWTLPAVTATGTMRIVQCGTIPH